VGAGTAVVVGVVVVGSVVGGALVTGPLEEAAAVVSATEDTAVVVEPGAAPSDAFAEHPAANSITANSAADPTDDTGRA